MMLALLFLGLVVQFALALIASVFVFEVLA